MNKIYKDGLTRRELRNIHTIKKQYGSKKNAKLKKIFKIGIASLLVLSSYRCIHGQELEEKNFSYLEQTVILNELYSANKVRDLYEEPIYRFRLPECETQCYLH